MPRTPLARPAAPDVADIIVVTVVASAGVGPFRADGDRHERVDPFLPTRDRAKAHPQWIDERGHVWTPRDYDGPPPPEYPIEEG